MDRVREALEALRARWSSLSRLVKIAIILGLVSLITIGGVAYYLNTRVQYSVLFSNLSQGDAGTITQQLESDNVSYKLADNGTTILVDKTKVDQLRIDLAVDNKLPSSSKGFELFDSSNVMTTDSDRKIMYQRALTGELEKSIEALDDVSKAKVNLTMASSDNVFDSSNSKKAKASIVLTLKNGSISNDAVQGIVALTVGAVPNLNKTNVKVVDQSGKVLNKSDSSSDSTTATSKYMKLERQYEKQMEKKILKLIEPIVGTNKIRVSVNADLNFNAIQSKTTKYSNPQVRSENVQASGNNTTVTQAQTGAVNDNVDNVYNGSDGSNATYSRTVNNELNTEITKVINAPGSINRLTSSVVIDGDLSAGDRRSIRRLVQGALGYDQARGDTVQVQAVNFARQKSAKKKAATKAKKAQTNWWLIGGIIAGVVVALGILAFILIRRRRRAEEEEEEYYDDDYDVDVTGEDEEDDAQAQAAQAAAQAEIERRERENEAKRRQVDSNEQKAKVYAESHPDVAADLITAWVKESMANGNNNKK